MTSDSHQTSVVEVSALVERQEAVGVVELNGDSRCVILEFGQQGHGEELTVLTLDHFGVGNTTGDGQHIELCVGLFVGHETYVNGQKKIKPPEGAWLLLKQVQRNIYPTQRQR